MLRTMNTRRLRRSSDGQRSSQAGRMEDVLHAVDHGRPVGALGDVDDALQAQEIAAAVLGQRLQQQRQGDGVHRLLAQDGEAGNARVVRAGSCRGRVRARGRAASRPSHAGTSRLAARRASSPMSNSCAGSTSPKDAVSTRGRRIEGGERAARHPLARRRSRSVLVRIRRSATATCFTDSGCRAERRETVDGIDGRHHAGEREALRRGRHRSSAHAGSAPDRRARWSRSRRARRAAPRPRRAAAGCPPACSTRSPRIVQHRHPVCSSTKLSSLVSIRSWSSPTSPNSLMITAVRENSGLRSRRAQQRGLAAAEEAGQHRDRDHGGTTRQRRDAQPRPAR